MSQVKVVEQPVTTAPETQECIQAPADAARSLDLARAEDRAWRLARRAELERAVKRVNLCFGIVMGAIATASPMITNHVMWVVRESSGFGRPGYGQALMAAVLTAVLLPTVAALGTGLFVERRKTLTRQIAELCSEPAGSSEPE